MTLLHYMLMVTGWDPCLVRTVQKTYMEARNLVNPMSSKLKEVPCSQEMPCSPHLRRRRTRHRGPPRLRHHHRQCNGSPHSEHQRLPRRHRSAPSDQMSSPHPDTRKCTAQHGTRGRRIKYPGSLREGFQNPPHHPTPTTSGASEKRLNLTKMVQALLVRMVQWKSMAVTKSVRLAL